MTYCTLTAAAIAAKARLYADNKLRYAYNKRQARHFARLKQMCGECIHRRAVPGTSSCDVCTLGHANRLRTRVRRDVRNREIGFCDSCLASGFHRFDCDRQQQVAA